MCVFVFLCVLCVRSLFEVLNEKQSMASEEQPSCSKSKRPLKNFSGGFGKYCCVPDCKSAAINSDRKSTGISLF